MKRIVTIIWSLAIIICSSTLYASNDDAVLSVTGPDAITLGENLNGITVNFSSITKKHDVTLQIIDTKGRLCGIHKEIIEPPAKGIHVNMAVINPVGNNHRIEILLDGKTQAASHDFHVTFPYQPWDDYQPINWADYEAGMTPLLREAGFSGTIWRGRKTADNDLKFYPDNITYDAFAHYHKRRKEFNAMKEVWAKYPERRPLNHRRPSLTDPGTFDLVRKELATKIEEVRDYRPLFYNIADEIGVADQSSTSDLDWSYSSRDAWRNWLKDKYGNVPALNKQWETSFSNWPEVRSFFPSTHYIYDQLWEKHLLPNAFTNIDNFNKVFATDYASFAKVINGYKNIRSNDERMALSGLKERYKEITTLNKKLNNQFSSFEDAAKYIEILEDWISKQDANDTRGWNLSWWCDFRDYMEDYISIGLAKARDIAREYDPDGCFGITGTHHPGVFNGHNYDKLIKSVDFIIPYNIGQCFELIRGLNPDFPYMYPTWATENKLKRDLWYTFLHGCRGVLVWDNHEEKNKMIDRATNKLTVRGEAAKPVFKEIKSGTDQLLLKSHREHNGIAIYFSQPSARVEWIQRNIGTGRHYIEQSSHATFKSSSRSLLRSAWVKLIEDNNLQYIFVSPEQVAAGRLKEEGISLLILPEVLAMSNEEAKNIKSFTKAGGTVLADQFTGLYDAQGKRRTTGVLDNLFGIDQTDIIGDKRTVAGLQSLISPDLNIPATSRDIPARNGNRAGKAIFLGKDVSHYSRIRGNNQMEAGKIASFVGSLFPADVKPFAKVLDKDTGILQSGTEVEVFTLGTSRKIVSVQRNYVQRRSGIGGELYTDNSLFESDEDVIISLEQPYYVCNQRTGEMYGKTNNVALVLSPWEPIILTVQKVPFTKSPVLTAPESIKQGEVFNIDILGNDMLDTLQVFHIEVINPNGESLWYHEKDINTRNSRATYSLPLAMNAIPGIWQVIVTDAATKQSEKVAVKVE